MNAPQEPLAARFDEAVDLLWHALSILNMPQHERDTRETRRDTRELAASISAFVRAAAEL